MIDAIQVVINGLLVGLVYALVAVSFIVVYRSSRIVNLAQGEIVLRARPAQIFKHRTCHFVPAWELFFSPEPMNGC